MYLFKAAFLSILWQMGNVPWHLYLLFLNISLQVQESCTPSLEQCKEWEAVTFSASLWVGVLICVLEHNHCKAVRKQSFLFLRFTDLLSLMPLTHFNLPGLTNVALSSKEGEPNSWLNPILSLPKWNIETLTHFHSLCYTLDTFIKTEPIVLL